MTARDVSARLAAEEALRASEARFRTVVSGSYDVTALIDANGVVQWVTPNCERLLGSTPDQIVGRDSLDWVHPDDLGAMAEALATFAAGEGVSSPAPIRMRHIDGRWRDVEVVATDFLDNPDISGIAVNLRDIGERVAIERERERLAQIVAMTRDVVSTYDLSGRPVYLNDAARRFIGVSPDTPLDSIDMRSYLAPSGRREVIRELARAAAGRRTWTGELELLDANGEVVAMQAQMLGHTDASGTLVHVSMVLHDISERKSFERRLRHEATHDRLTALPNRTLLLDRLGTAIERARRHGTGLALLFCDLDHFKVVNDSLGHGRGDRVLIEVARRLCQQVCPGDTVARLGGDEFVILGEDCDTVDDAIAIAARVDQVMQHAIDIDGTQVHVGVSIGISLAAPVTGDVVDGESVIRDADAAMYRAKQRGRGRYQVYEPDHMPGFLERACHRLELDRALRRAVGRGELAVVYQPVVALRERAGAGIVGAEALVRWDHPLWGRLLPAEFIDLAEENGIIHDLGAWVLETACGQLARWLDQLPGLAPFSLAVNLSGRQLEDTGVVGVVESALASSQIPAERLDLEITESVLLHDTSSAAEIVTSLKNLGVNVSVDDFGTGYSSLSYLRRFPVDRLKVDRSFVEGLGAEPEDGIIVGAIIDLAHALGLTTVGEGVATPAQAEALAKLGCDLGQGHHLGTPMTGAELAALLSDQRRCTRAGSASRSGARRGGA